MNEKRIPLFAICLFSMVLAGFSHENKSVKATWIWQTDLIDTEREEILAFCEEKGINLIYLNVNPEDPV